MSWKKVLGVGAVVVLGGAAGTYYWLRAHERPVHEVAAAEPPGFHEVPPPPEIAKSSPPKEMKPAETNAVSTPADVRPVDEGLPVRTGEVLEFVANVSNLQKVATLRLQVAGRGSLLGKSAWHLQAFAHTENPLRMVFELDDRFDSYSDARTMASLQYEMHLSERGQKLESVQRMTATGKEPASSDATEARVPPGTRDPLGFMQYLRDVDWVKTPEVRSPVYDGHNLYDVRAKREATGEKVTVAAGDYVTSKIGIRVLEDGVEKKDAVFGLYLANNESHTPVLLEAVMPFATARVELAKAK